MPEQPITPRLLDYRPPEGNPACGWVDTAVSPNPCGHPGTWHILWSAAETPAHDGAPAGAAAGFLCTPHMDTANARYAYHDRHQVSGNCDMPGTYWSIPEGRCGVPADNPTTGDPQ